MQSTIADITPLWSLSVIEKVEMLNTTASWIVLTDDTKDKNRNFYTVLKCGPEVTIIKEWDIIVIAEHSGDVFKLSWDKEYKIINEHQILWIINK